MRQGARSQAADDRLTRRTLTRRTLTRRTLSRRTLSWRALLGGAIAAALLWPGASDAGDPGGWDRARWGMTEAELKAAFGPDLQAAEPPLAFGPLIAPQVVPRVTLAGRPFVAFLQLDRQGGRLVQVLLRYRGRNPTHSDFEALAAALTAELGPPAAADSSSDYSGSFLSFETFRQWRLAATTVSLAYRDPNAEPYSGVRKELVIRYAPAGGPR